MAGQGRIIKILNKTNLDFFSIQKLPIHVRTKLRKENQAFVSATNFLKEEHQFNLNDQAEQFHGKRNRFYSIRRGQVIVNKTDIEDMAKIHPDFLPNYNKELEALKNRPQSSEQLVEELKGIVNELRGHADTNSQTLHEKIADMHGKIAAMQDTIESQKLTIALYKQMVDKS